MPRQPRGGRPLLEHQSHQSGLPALLLHRAARELRDRPAGEPLDGGTIESPPPGTNVRIETKVRSAPLQDVNVAQLTPPASRC
ncbi:penicillin-insensitive murein endopeptidase [Rhodococcus zopfii]|uniref:Penicillin-insensitive murein endopeptidase n=1 Tax=Rhodococcus zopfii TaxID=43772 RepID=A0ABU3WN08_9NOCA|nr:penicillin-insensitive murein endopeptidase [Rhodococcus zopfii]